MNNLGLVIITLPSSVSPVSLNQVTDFYEPWHEYYATAQYSNLVFCNTQLQRVFLSATECGTAGSSSVTVQQLTSSALH